MGSGQEKRNSEIKKNDKNNNKKNNKNKNLHKFEYSLKLKLEVQSLKGLFFLES